MKQTKAFYIAMLILFFVGCKGKEKSKQLNYFDDSVLLNSDWYVPDTGMAWKSIADSGAVTTDPSSLPVRVTGVIDGIYHPTTRTYQWFYDTISDENQRRVQPIGGSGCGTVKRYYPKEDGDYSGWGNLVDPSLIPKHYIYIYRDTCVGYLLTSGDGCLGWMPHKCNYPEHNKY